MFNKLNFFSLALLLPGLFGFTFLSGPHEAHLPVSPSSPSIEFIWDGSTVKIGDQDEFLDGKYKNLSEEEFMNELLIRAFGVWNTVKGSYLRMTVKQENNEDIDENDDVNVIAVKGGINASAAAFAQPSLTDNKNEIRDCDITISDVKTTAEDLLYTLVHEIGHCVGLGHNHTNYNSLMGYSRMSRMPKLGADDKAGLIYLYPDPKYKSDRKEFLACAVIQGDDKGQLGLILFLVVPFIVGAFSFRRRRVLN